MSTEIRDQRVNARDLIISKRGHGDALPFYLTAIQESTDEKHGIPGSLNRWFDMRYPSSEYPDRKLPNGGELTGIEYAMMHMDIIPRTIPERGLWSSNIRAFFDAENALVNYGLFQEFVAMQQTIVAPLAPDLLNQVVAMSVPFSGNGFMVPYLADSVSDRQQYRVEQGADIRLVSMPFNSRSIKPFTYGKGIEITYQAIRRSSFTVEAFALEIQRINMQGRLDRMRAAADVAINGDTQYGGTVGSAPVTNLTTLDPATAAGKFTYIAYNALMPLAQTDSGGQNSGWYNWDTVIGNAATLSTLVNMGGLTNGFLPFVNLPAGVQQAGNVAFVRAAGVYEPVVMITNPNAPAGMATFLNHHFALIEGEEIGGQLQERERIMRNQTERAYVTSSIATGVWHAGAIRVVNTQA